MGDAVLLGRAEVDGKKDGKADGKNKDNGKKGGARAALRGTALKGMPRREACARSGGKAMLISSTGLKAMAMARRGGQGPRTEHGWEVNIHASSR